ncbi:MAG: UbiA family prenyltransferase [Planctomycetota bacterium]|jgi:1,4-dihydroxy-2-naphthoate octaprenyltransferase
MPDEGPKAGVRLLLRWKALRAFSFPLSVLPVVIAAAAVKPFGEWDLAVLGVSVLGVMLLHGTGNLLNDFFDFRSGVDRRVEGDEKRPGRFLVRGELRPRDVLVEALVCLVLAGGAAGYLVWVRGPEVLWYGLPAVVALYVYTGPPFKLKYRALGEVVVFAAFGPILMAGAAYVQAGEVPLAVILLSIPVGMVTTSVLLGNNLRDAEEDSGAGAKTLVHVVGGGSVKVLYIFFVIVPPIITAGFAAFGLVPMGTAAALVSLVPAAFLVVQSVRKQRIPDIDARTARFCVVFMVMVGVGLLISRSGLCPHL